MLGKLMKYEIKATSRTFLPLYFVLLVSALINRLLGPLTQDSIRIPNIISMSLYVIILIGMFVMTFIVMISRFYKNLLSDEGYLMFTLPVKTWQHISGKLIISVIWITISFIMAIASILIIATREVTLSDISMSIKILWELITEKLGPSTWTVITQIILAAVFTMISSVLMIYASIVLGHLVTRHKILASFGAFIILNTISQILSAVAASIMFRTDIVSLNNVEITPADFLFQKIMWFAIIFSAIGSVVYFVITNIILTKRLNLE